MGTGEYAQGQLKALYSAMSSIHGEVQAQYILCDMAGRVVTAGLSVDAALKEAHKRVEDIHRLRSRG